MAAGRDDTATGISCTVKGGMANFAAFVMRRPWNAALVAAIFSLLSIMLPLFSQVSGAVVGLVTLRLGAVQGFLVMGGAALCTTVIALIARLGSNMTTAAFFAAILLVTWLPTWALALVLRQSRSLAATLGVAGLFGAIVVIAIHVTVGDASDWWHQLLSQTLQPLLQETGTAINGDQVERIITAMSEAMTGLLGAACVLTIMTSLFLARWWQAILYNPGGFKQEVQALHIDWRASAFLAAAMALLILSSTDSTSLGGDLLVVLLAFYMLPGLALVHWIVTATGSHGIWLVVLYGLMFFLPPQVMVVLAALGFTDSWMDLRRRLKIGKGPR